MRNRILLMINKTFYKFLKENGFKIILCDYFDNLLSSYGSDDLQDCYCFLNNNSDYITFDDLLGTEINGNAPDSAYFISYMGGVKKYLFVDCSVKFILNVLRI